MATRFQWRGRLSESNDSSAPIEMDLTQRWTQQSTNQIPLHATLQNNFILSPWSGSTGVYTEVLWWIYFYLCLWHHGTGYAAGYQQTEKEMSVEISFMHICFLSDINEWNHEFFICKDKPYFSNNCVFEITDFKCSKWSNQFKSKKLFFKLAHSCPLTKTIIWHPPVDCIGSKMWTRGPWHPYPVRNPVTGTATSFCIRVWREVTVQNFAMHPTNDTIAMTSVCSLWSL